MLLLTIRSGAPGRTRTCNRRLSLPTTAFAALLTQVCGLDYLFTVSGAARIVSTEPCDNQRQSVYALPDNSWMLLPSAKHSSECESLLEKINLSLQNTQVTLTSGVMRQVHLSHSVPKYGQPQVSTGLPSALPVKGSPLQCSPLYRFSFPAQAPHLKAEALSS